MEIAEKFGRLGPVENERVRRPCMQYRALHLSFTTHTLSPTCRVWSRSLLPRQPHDIPNLGPCRPRSTGPCPCLSTADAPKQDFSLWQTSLIISGCKGPSSKTRVKKRAPIVDIDTNDLTDAEMTFVDPGRADGGNAGQDYSVNVAIPTTAVNTRTLPIRRNSILPSARSKNSLHQNLLYLINQRDPIPPLPALVDYHDTYPKLQSTRSYNLLIGLALRHASTGTAQWLFTSMKAREIPPNLETWKLHVRWLVRTDCWDQALKLVRKLWPYPHDVKHQQPEGPWWKFSLPIWLELFPLAGRGSAHRKTSSDDIPNDVNSAIPPRPIQGRPSDAVAARVLRYQILMGIKSLNVPETLAGIPPRLVYHMIWILYQFGEKAAAHSLTKAYLINLPEVLPFRWARPCLEIIHLHLVHGTSLKGLPRFLEVRQTLFSLLNLRREIRPTSSTLLLLLAPLRGAKHCGTIAWKVLRSFQSRFGFRVVDSRVRRRIIMLALKEGRMDIVNRILSYQQVSQLARRAWLLERDVLGGRELSPYRRLCRAPQRKIFRRTGKEQRTWRLLKRHLIPRTIAKQNWK